MESEAIIFPLLQGITANVFPSVPTDLDVNNPFVIFSRTDTEEFGRLDGPPQLSKQEITVSIFAPDFVTALNLGTEIKAVLNGYSSPTCQYIKMKRQSSPPQTDLEPLLAHVQQIYWVFVNQVTRIMAQATISGTSTLRAQSISTARIQGTSNLLAVGSETGGGSSSSSSSSDSSSSS